MNHPFQSMPMNPALFPMNKMSLAPALYVGDLDENIQEEVLHDFFSRFGPIHFVRIMRDSTTGKSRGYAFINFIHPRDAESAKQYAQYEKIGRKHIRIMFKRNIRDLPADANIYVKNIDPQATVKDLHNHFAEVGPILCCKVSTNANGESLGYGYVQFEKSEDAQTALKTLQGSKLKETNLILEAFVSKEKRGSHERRNIYVKNLPLGKTQSEIEKIVADLFKKYGEIEMMLVKKHPTEDKYSAFVCFKEQGAAEKAYSDLTSNPITLPGAPETLYVNWYQGKAERQRELKRQFSQIQNQTNLYVKNLRLDVTEQELKTAFQHFGKVTSIALRDWKSPNGDKSGKYGFVAFDNPDDARKALTQAHKNPDVIALYQKGAMPYINIHQSREKRNEYLLSLRRKRMQTVFGMPDMFPPMQFPFPNRRFPPYQQPFPMMNHHGRYQPKTAFKQHPAPKKQANQSAHPKTAGKHTQAPKTISKQPEKQKAQPKPEPITVQSLKAKMNEFLQLDEEKQRQILGELLYPQVKNYAGETYAPKITGMLIDLSVLEVSEILEFLEDAELLKERVDEAMELIRGENQ